MACDCPPPSADDGTWDMQDGDGPCRTWPLAPDCSSCFEDCGHTPERMPPQLRAAVESATEVLWRLTAGRYGLCREIVRPCRQDCAPDLASRYRVGPGMYPDVNANGQWINLSGCTCLPSSCDSCGCGQGVAEIELPGPVYAPHRPAPHGSCSWASEYPVQVWIDGVPLSPDRYRVLEPSKLIRVDGGSWPGFQDMASAYDEPGAFAVEYWRGRPVPIGGRRAVTILACEMYKRCVGDGSCALPQRVQTVQREGISFTMIDQMEFLTNGRTGLSEVDMWLSAVNPGAMRSPSTVLSPDQFLARHEPMRPHGFAPRYGRGGWR